MKKLTSVILAITMIFTLFSPAFASSEECNCSMTPVVYVVGFGDPIYSDVENEISAFPPDSEAIKSAVPELLIAVFGSLLIGNHDIFGKYASAAVNKMLGSLALNSDGTAPEKSGIDQTNSVYYDTHKIPAFGENENGTEGYFKFHYDWRLSPIENAVLLNDYIEDVKEITGHGKIVLSAHSQGNTVVTSYLHLYGSDSLEKAVFLSPAYQGLSLLGALFTKEVDVSGKGDDLVLYLKGIMGGDNAAVSIVSALNRTGLINFILNRLQKLIDSQLGRIYDDCLIDLFGTMPGLWSFVPAENYEQAKATMLGDNEKYSAIIEKTDYYYENVQTKTAELLKSAEENGTEIIIVAGYDISTIPVTGKDASHGDYLIDTEYMSLGAVCSGISENLGNGYVQADDACGHIHISPENTIDASACEFPEYTWFVKGNGHSDFSDDYNEFIEWLIRFDGQPTVHSDEKYPQFITDTEDGILPVKIPKQ